MTVKQRGMLTRAALSAALTLPISARANQMVPYRELDVEIHGETLSFNGQRLAGLSSLKQECAGSHGSFAGAIVRLTSDVNTPHFRIAQVEAILEIVCKVSLINSVIRR